MSDSLSNHNLTLMGRGSESMNLQSAPKLSTGNVDMINTNFDTEELILILFSRITSQSEL